VVNLSLSTLGSELHAPLTTIQWVISGYLLSLALLLPLSGWLVDRIGTKRVYVFCFTAFHTYLPAVRRSAFSGESDLFSLAARASGGLLAPMAQIVLARIGGRHVPRVMGRLRCR